jgi:UDP-N-acetylmuramoyl-L-alanyl-D-glutamate--2,6-diaminopimelate ligase
MTFDLEQLNNLGVNIANLVTDSRHVKQGDTFVAYPGGQTDGRQYIQQAIEQGANAVIWDAHHFVWNSRWQIPNLAVPQLREVAGAIANEVYRQPSEKLWMVGITGTNGKTSCSNWLAKSFAALGKTSALIGTLGNGFPDALQATVNTTPDAIRVHGLLAEFVNQHAQVVAMEVSSHALVQGRVNGVNFDVALLTNLSRDHLDYHGDMENYAAAKQRLFDWDQLKTAVLNLDDAYGATLAETLREAKIEVVGYGLNETSLRLAERLGIRMVYATDLQMNATGMYLQINSSWGQVALQSGLIGRFNAANLLGSLAVLLVSEIDIKSAAKVLGQQVAVAGRMQTFGGHGQPTVVVDYAHTPDALEKVLQTLREVTSSSSGKLICVFGCGGDRDQGKRPMMGVVANRFADVRIVTSDNPRSENPQSIIDAIVAAMPNAHQVIVDRAQAITNAIEMAQPQDTILLAGKGHEDYQEISGIRYPFSDVALAQAALAGWKLVSEQASRVAA